MRDRDRHDPRVAVFTLTYNRVEYTRRMLESLERSTGLPYDHFVIDNGSEDETRALLAPRPGRIAEVVFNGENKGISVASNQALDLIGDGYDYIVKLDNDCEIVTPGWLETLIDVCRAADDKFVLSPYVDGLEGGTYAGGYPRIEHVRLAGRQVGLSMHVGGICALAPSSAYAGFRFPTDVPMHGNQDVLFSIHVRTECGFRMGYVEDVRVRNIDGRLQFAKYPEYFARRYDEAYSVYGEPVLFTKLAAPFRQIRLINAMHKAGLSDRTVAKAALTKVKRLCASCMPARVKEKLENGGKEWT